LRVALVRVGERRGRSLDWQAKLNVLGMRDELALRGRPALRPALLPRGQFGGVARLSARRQGRRHREQRGGA
jgi:hypothetical protein